MARITVVDDYPEFLSLMHDLVTQQGGHDFVGFDGAETSYAEIAGTRPDVLVIDLRLAADGLSGWDVLALARSDDAMRDVPIIVCSADISQVRRRTKEFEQIGNIHVRIKPFDTDEMVELIDRLALQPRLTLRLRTAATATLVQAGGCSRRRDERYRRGPSPSVLGTTTTDSQLGVDAP
jgi:DNA-binding NtrC family response regulator